MTTLYYGQVIPSGIEAEDLTKEPLPPDGDFYEPPANGIVLTRSALAWESEGEIRFRVLAVEVPLDEPALRFLRHAAKTRGESFDIPEHIVNASPRRYVSGERGDK